MRTHHQRLQKAGSLAFALAAVGLFVCAMLWPSAIAEVLRSRLVVFAIATWCGGFAILLHPEFRAGWAEGIREFHDAARYVMREIIRVIRGDDDDDDGPKAA